MILPIIPKHFRVGNRLNSPIPSAAKHAMKTNRLKFSFGKFIKGVELIF
jgi:hypothetical protein